MAGRQASFLEPEERAKLMKETKGHGAKRSASSRNRASKTTSIEGEAAAASAAAVAEMEAAMQNTGPTGDGEQLSGCFVCKFDNDHSNLLLCEGCNGEYHTYCLKPKLKAIPKDDWYCGTLKVNEQSNKAQPHCY
jgi:hypothetical protein